MNPALPGTLLALAAAVLLALATVTVPVTTSLYFLEVTASTRSTAETLRFGTLGYCVNSTCSSASVGYNVTDAADLLGVSGSASFLKSLATDAVRDLTYVLILHPIACGLAALAFLLGVLQHCAFGMGCLATFVAGLATTVSLASFAIDLALFTILKKRVESAGGTASYGQASSSGGRSRGRGKKDNDDYHTPHPDPNAYGQRMRMDALEAEQNRKGAGTGHLPQFAEYEHVVPLKDDYEYRDYADDGRGYGDYGQAGVGRTFGQSQGAYGSGGYHGSGGAGYVNGVGPAYGGGSGAAAPGAAAAGLAAASAYHSAAPRDDTGRTEYTDDPYGRSHRGDEFTTEVAGQAYGGEEEFYPYPNPHQADPSQPTSGYAHPHAGSGSGGQTVGYYADEASPQTQHSNAYQYPTAHDSGNQGYGQYADPAPVAQPERSRSLAQSVTSGYAVGGPSTMAMPVPLPAQGRHSAAQRLAMSSTNDTGYQSRGQQRSDVYTDASETGGAVDPYGGGGGGGQASTYAPQQASSSTGRGDAYYDSQYQQQHPQHPQQHQQQQDDAYEDYQYHNPANTSSSTAAAQVAPNSNAYSYQEGQYHQQEQEQQPEVPSYEAATAISSASPVAGAAPGAAGGGGGGSGGMGRRGPLPVPGGASASGGYPNEKTPR
ncbi:pali-domain-containing protein [Microstroma glucosiphilum]|uniref:Pali-domain-containing protein n=1 Tax=Pseudomicrostroma glucosiphilum TaxID=1684307 RepID=A0A316U3Q6_9BASI|nr:pali-domain-containing protein [Pseudomicrostroma glucosiphilum]PWN19448.1 pali-domain-containing protein [Pseudomicrostroma glucosiphilum]